MLKIWGRNTSSNVQKVDVGDGRAGCRIRTHRCRRRVRQDQRGALSGDESQRRWCRPWKRKTAFCCGNRTRSCAISPPSTAAGTLEPADPQTARTGEPDVDGLAVVGLRTGDHAGVLGSDPHAARQARHGRDRQPARRRPIDAAQMLDAQLGKTAYLAGDAFSYGDIPVGVMAYRLPATGAPSGRRYANLDRWYAAIDRQRKAFSGSRRAPFALQSIQLRLCPGHPRLS